MTAIIIERHHPKISIFIVLSLVVHLSALAMNKSFLVTISEAPKKPPIKVKYIEPEKKPLFKKKSTFIDSAKPRKIEKPDRSELLAAYDSRVHSDTKNIKSSKYTNFKDVVPKSRGQKGIKPKAKPVPKKIKKPRAKQPAAKKKMEKFRLSDKGILRFEPKAAKPVEAVKEKKPGTGSSLALLDGFDADKFASMNTDSDKEADDDEPISLNTTEIKYASYFARIKHQIERVWTYPEEAARKGISGEITLRFQISKDGNLVEVYLVDASGSELLDFAAIKAVKGAAPFYPFPVTIKKDKLSILATFIYTPNYGAYYRR